ncbi:MAG: portal protein, partial [Candidatus Methanospirareceae archaeon]
ERHDKTIVNFIPQHLKGIYIAQNRSGDIDTVFHRMRLSSRDLLTTYPDTIPSNKKRDYEKNPFDKVTVWRAVLPNSDRVLRSLGPRGMAFSSITYLEDMDAPLKEGGYKRMPYDIWRPLVSTGEAYGKSPAWYALGDIKRLNMVQKDLLELASLSVKPPLNVPSEQLESVNVTPWGMNPYSDPSRRIFPMELGGNFPYGAEELAMLKKQVQSYFKVEAFQLLSMMADKEYTATQAAEMAGEKSAQLTSLTSRVTRFIDGMVENTLLIGLDTGFIPMPPPELMKSGIKIDYVGPLTMDQERAFQTTGILRGLNQIAPFLEAKPDIWTLIKEKDVFRKILDGSGFPKNLLRNKQEVKAIEEEQARQQEEMRQSQLQKEGAQAYKDGTWHPEKGSISEKAVGNP